MSSISEEELILRGGCLLAAQRVEFALYGVAAHASHTQAAQKEKRFKELSAEKFLRGNPDDLKATLGQLIHVFGNSFLIKTSDLVEFCDDRNLIAHNFYRKFYARIRGVPNDGDPIEFLRRFLERALEWEAVLRGFLRELMRAAAKKEGRESELNFSATDLANIRKFHNNVQKYLKERDAGFDH